MKILIGPFPIVLILLIMTGCNSNNKKSKTGAITNDMADSGRPNIVIIMADDMGYGDPQCYNSESKIPTPNMDKLSEQGVRFTDAHSPASVCTPSRYGLLTGSYAWRSRLKKGVSWSGYDEPLIPKSRETLAGNNTLLIVTSDNGGTRTSDDGRDYGHKTSGNVLRGFKGGLYEGGHRVPFIMRWPGKLPEGKVNDGLLCLTDLFATFSSMMGETPNSGSGEDSFNILPLLLKGESVRDNLVMHNGDFAIRRDEWKLILNGNQTVVGDRNELYNLRDDPGETDNVIEKYPEITKELTLLLDQFKRQGYSY